MSPDEISDLDFNELDQLDVDTMLADEARDAIDHRIPVRCIVRNHDFHPRTHYCRRCGNSRNDELNQTRVWL